MDFWSKKFDFKKVQLLKKKIFFFWFFELTLKERLFVWPKKRKYIKILFFSEVFEKNIFTVHCITERVYFVDIVFPLFLLKMAKNAKMTSLWCSGQPFWWCSGLQKYFFRKLHQKTQVASILLFFIRRTVFSVGTPGKSGNKVALLLLRAVQKIYKTYFLQFFLSGFFENFCLVNFR